tara:strand:- start:1101 stop:1409 length:309 start_codon:yes stop_codon:yes gene_type:complete
MNWKVKFQKWFEENVASSDPTLDPDKVKCYIDDKEEDCFVGKIEGLGYQYDDGNDWWERTWSTDSEPKETIREVFQQLESGRWNKLMIGYGDQIFYEVSCDE